MDNLIECSRCGSDACYMQEVSLGVNLHWCYGCGFTSNTTMKLGDDFFTSQMEILPEIYKALTVEDETGKIWIPSTINVPDKGMVFATGTSPEEWMWAGVKAVPVLEAEKEKFKLKNGNYAEWKMDMSTIKYFPEREYMEVLSYLGILPE